MGPVDPVMLEGEGWVWGRCSCCPHRAQQGEQIPGGGLVVLLPPHEAKEGDANLAEGLMVP